MIASMIKKYSGLIFLDIQKAFDTEDHKLQIAKLNSMVSEALLKISLNFLLWKINQDYIQLIGEFPKDQL